MQMNRVQPANQQRAQNNVTVLTSTFGNGFSIDAIRCSEIDRNVQKTRTFVEIKPRRLW
jgi:hypothetical protein